MSGLFASFKSDARRRWKLLAITAIVILALVSSSYAHWRITAPSSPALYVTATIPPLELRMELDKREFQQGEEVVVRLSLKNIESEKVDVGFPQWAASNDDPGVRHVLNFVVRDANDTIVYIRFELFFQSVVDFSLEPGEQHSEILKWTQTYNQEPYAGQPFKTGTYKIIGQTSSYDVWPKSRFETPPITITIV